MTAYSPVSYTVAGGSPRGPFVFTFPYLETEHVKVKLNDAVLLEADYSVETSPTTQVRLTDDAEAGDKIVVYRETSIDERLVDWQDASVITEDNLDRADDQFHYLIQEAYFAGFGALSQNSEGNWDAQGNRIINVGDPLDAKDATNKDYVDAQVLYDGAAVPQNWSFVTVTGSETQFTLTSPTPASVDPRFYIVTIDGVTQSAVDDYTINESGGNFTINFNNPPITQAGQKVVVRNFGNARSILGNPVMPPTVNDPALALQGLTGQVEDVFELYDTTGTSTLASIDSDGNAVCQDLTVLGTLTATIAGGTYTGNVTGNLTGDVLAANGEIIVDSGATLATSTVHGTFDGELDGATGSVNAIYLVNCIVAGDGMGGPGVLRVAPLASNGLTAATILTGPMAGSSYGGRIYWATEGPVMVGGSTGTLGTTNGCSVAVTTTAVTLTTNGGAGDVIVSGGGDLRVNNSGNLIVTGKTTQTADGTADDDLLRKEQVVNLLPNISAVDDVTEAISTTYAASTVAISTGNVSKTRVDEIGAAAVITNSDDNHIGISFYVDAGADTNNGAMVAQISSDGATWITVWEYERGGGAGYSYRIPCYFFVPAGWRYRIGNDDAGNTNNVRQVLRYTF